MEQRPPFRSCHITMGTSQTPKKLNEIIILGCNLNILGVWDAINLTLNLTGVRLGGARRNHAVVEELVIQGVGEAGRSVFVDGHGRIVSEVRVVQHLEHFISSNLSKLIKSSLIKAPQNA